MAVTTGERLQAGILAAKQGHVQAAKELLAGVVMVDPNADQAWFWLGKILSSPDQSAECFRRALAVNPANQEAQQALLDLIRPDLSFMPKSEPSGPMSSRPAFIPETDAFSYPPPSPSGKNKAETLSPFAGPPAEGDTLPPENPSGPTSPPYVPPFDEPIEEGDEILSLEDRAALAAEADQRVTRKPTEPALEAELVAEPPGWMEAPPVPSEPAAPVAARSEEELPRAEFPEQPPRKASGLIFGICGFILAVMLLGFPGLLLNQEGGITAAIADLFPPAQTQAEVVVPESPTLVPVESLPTPAPVEAPTFTPVPTQSLNRRLEAIHAESLSGQELNSQRKVCPGCPGLGCGSQHCP